MLGNNLTPLPELVAQNLATPNTDWLQDVPPELRGAFDQTGPVLARLLARAPYLRGLAIAEAAWLATALGTSADEALAAILLTLREAGQTNADRDQLSGLLRVAKARVALLAAIAETGNVWTTAEACAALSDLADTALDASLNVLLREAVERGDLAVPAAPEMASKCGLSILALGKHGGRELNYSSDIDIVAFYDPQADILADPSEASVFYTRIVRRMAALMQDRTENGYVFRTDLRLRPDPGSTPVALSVDGALTYYESRGQNWERAAWIKARACAGDRGVGAKFLKNLAPFVWRKHLDFATIADIQAMKRQINIAKNVGAERVAGHNVKLGRGGIREIEFFTQTQQLIAGGRDIALRERPTTVALKALTLARWIAPETADDLTKTYWYLRAVENRVQMVNDEQTHKLPDDEAGLENIAALMGDADTDAFCDRYRAALGVVARNYSELFTEGETLGVGGGNLVFTGTDDDPGTLETLAQMGFSDPGRASEIIRKWHYGSYRATRAAAARAHLTELLPALLATMSGAGNADESLARFDHFLSRLPTGVQLFALLRNHEQLRRLLVAFMASAPRMAEAVIHRAHVMDGLIDPAFADEVGRHQVLVDKVDGFLAEARSFEEVIDHARIIGQEQKFLISAGLVAETMDAHRAANQFSALAETLLERLFEAVRQEFETKHGKIAGSRVALLGFGKMASREMSVVSDLDFILLYDAPSGADASDGARSLETPHYFTRLTQRLVAALSAPTAEGVLYQPDMRLRPSGNAGPLATTLAAFRSYQINKAWTWEHLALTRARVVFADGELEADIDAAIADILATPRDRANTVADVLNMRARIAKERPPRHPFDLKLADGGIIDLEFLAQSAQLLEPEAIAAPQASVAKVLAKLGQTGLVPTGERLVEIHRTYATIQQAMSTCLVYPFREDAWTPAFRELLARLTNYPDFSRLTADMETMQGEVRDATKRWYDKIGK